MRRTLLLTSMLVLFLPASAPAKVILGSCIDGVSLWDSPERVQREWGKPMRKETLNEYDFEWTYRTGSVFFSRYSPGTPGIAIGVSTTRRTERTAAGIGVGSSERALRVAHPRVVCTGTKTRTCTVGGRGMWTTFTLKAARVSEVSVALDSGFDDGPRHQRDPRC